MTIGTSLPQSQRQVHNIYPRIVKFYPAEYLHIIEHQIIPKIVNSITNPEKQQNWQNYFDRLLPHKHLNYSSEETYLTSHDISKMDVVQNSINQIFPDMDSTETLDLAKSFIPLLSKSKIQVLQSNGLAIYHEVIQSMEYIRTIQALIQRYKKPNSDYRGTAHRNSSSKKIVQAQINMLDNRLNGAHFRLQCKDEIEQTEMMLKILKFSLKDEYKNIIEFLNLSKNFFGLDMRYFDLNPNQKLAVEQALDFHNGVRSSSDELVRSVMIFMGELFEKNDLAPKEKAEHFLNISRFFFFNEFKEAEKGKNRLALTKKHIDRPYRVKTILHEVPIFAYLHKGTNDFFTELLEIGINGMLGIQDVFEPDKPTIDEISEFTMTRNIINVRKEFGLTKKELRVLLFFL